MTTVTRAQLTGMPAGLIGKRRRIGRQTRRVWSTALVHTISRPVIVVVMGGLRLRKHHGLSLASGRSWVANFRKATIRTRENVEKMHGGTPLTDADRLPWLRKIAEEIDSWRARHEFGVLTCSAPHRS